MQPNVHSSTIYNSQDMEATYHQKRTQITVRKWSKRNPCRLFVRVWISAATEENSMEASQKTKNRTTMWPSNPTPPYISEKKKKTQLTIIWKDTHTLIFIAILFTIAKIWKQYKCPSTDEWIKMWYVCVYTHTHIYTHNGILLSHTKEWNSAICNNVNGSRG